MIKADNKVIKYLSFIAFIISFLFMNYINFFHLEENLFNTDITNEILYIKLISETGQWLPECFIPGYELFTNRAAYLAVLFYYINDDVILSYKLTFVILQVLLAFILYKTLKSLDIEFEYRYIFMALLWSFGSFDVLRVLIFKGFSYTFIYIYILFIIYIYINYKRNFLGKNLCLFIAYIFTFYMALSGFRTFIFIILPIFLYEFISKILKKENTNEFIFSTKLLIINIVGCIIYKFILSKWIFTPSMNFDISNIKLYVLFCNIYNLAYRVIDMGNINADVCIIHGCFFIIFILSLLNYKKIFSSKQKKIINILLLSTFFVVLGNLVMGNTADTDSRYYVNFLLLVILCNIIFFQNLSLNYNKLLGVFICLIYFIVLMNYTVAFCSSRSNEYTKLVKAPLWISNTNLNKKVLDYLVNNNYKKIYSDFWKFNILPYYRNFEGFSAGAWNNSNDLEPFYFVSDRRMFEENKNKVAILLSDEELENLSNIGKYRMKDAIFKTKIDDINIYECNYNPIKPLIQLPKNKNDVETIKLDNPKINTVGEIKSGKLISDEQIEGYILFGPYINDNNLKYGEFIPEKNIYDIELDYKILNDNKNKVFFEVAFDGGKIIERQELDKNSEICILNGIDLSGKKNIEFRVFKENGISIEVRKIKITKK